MTHLAPSAVTPNGLSPARWLSRLLFAPGEILGRAAVADRYFLFGVAVGDKPQEGVRLNWSTEL